MKIRLKLEFISVLIKIPTSTSSSTLENPYESKLVMDCAEGMNYIAKKGYVHRDLAARNVLLYLPETFIESRNLEILENLNVPIGRVRKFS